MALDHELRRLHIASHAQRLGLGILTLAFLMSLPTSAHAQQSLEIDSQHSVAHFSVGSGSNVLETGVARVNGKLVLEGPNDSPFLEVTVQPEDEHQPDYAKLSFISKDAIRRSDGKLVVTGDLTVTRVERSVTAEANEAYHGPDYGPPVVYAATQQIALVIPEPHSLTEPSSIQRLSAYTLVNRESFPPLMDALTSANWPTQLINNERCAVPATIGEDYSGSKCAGTVIAAVSNPSATTGSASGEGYYGFTPLAAPDVDHGAITLDLTLVPAASAGAAVIDGIGFLPADRSRN